jgi:hypothetical protein
MGLLAGLSDLMMIFGPELKAILSPSDDHAMLMTGVPAWASVDLNMPDRDQIFTCPSSPAEINQI